MKRCESLQKLILRRLLLYGRTTRPELVALTGSRAATVFEAIDALKASGLVIEPERRGKKTGRRAPELECNRKCARFLGVELRADGVTGVVTDSCGDTLEQYEARPAVPRRNLDDTRGEIARCIAELRRRIGGDWQLLKGVGFADPGTVDVGRGISLHAADIPGWENFAAAEWLAGECGVPAGVWPGRMVKTRMEYVSRLPDTPESLFLLVTDGGIGGGFIKDGSLFVGSTFQAMEIGHIVIDRNGPPCSCGSRGCLEAVVGTQGILEMVRAARRNGIDTELCEADFSIRRFVECSHRDKAARIIAGKVAESIGEALASAVAILNPATIVMSGELTGIGDLLLEAVRRSLEVNCLAGAVRRLKLEISTLEPGDTARGAAMMIRDRVWGIDGPHAIAKHKTGAKI